MAKWVIDPGHGGSEPGAMAYKGVTTEARMNLVVGLELARFLREYGETVFLTRESDKFLSLTERCIIANNHKADYFISVHHNSFNGTASGAEVIYSLKTPKVWADRVLNSLVDGMGVKRRSTYQRKNKSGRDYYAVLGGTNMQAMITEFCFIDNPSDYALVDTNDKLKKQAFYIAKACLENVGKKIKDTNTKPTTNNQPKPEAKPSVPAAKPNVISVPKAKAVVDFVVSREGKNIYSQNPTLRFQGDKGYSDCSGLMYGAYKKILNIDIGTYTEPQSLRGTLVGKINVMNESLMKPGDLVFYRGHSAIDKSRPYSIGHVEMYIGNNTLIGHGSGKGPTRKKFNSYRVNDFCMVRRYVDGNIEIKVAPPKPSGPVKKSKYFKDIPDNHWSIDAFDRAKEIGLIAGIGDGKVGFTNDKAMMISVILRAFNLLKQEIDKK